MKKKNNFQLNWVNIAVYFSQTFLTSIDTYMFHKTAGRMNFIPLCPAYKSKLLKNIWNRRYTMYNVRVWDRYLNWKWKTDSQGTPVRVFSEHVISTDCIGVPSDRFDHLYRLFLPTFPAFLSTSSLQPPRRLLLPITLFLTLPSCQVIQQNMYLSRMRSPSYISGSITLLPTSTTDPNSIISLSLYTSYNSLSTTSPLCPTITTAMVQQIHFTRLMRQYIQ